MPLHLPNFSVNVNVQHGGQPQQFAQPPYQQQGYAQAPPQHQAGPFDERTWYRLKNLQHPHKSLDVINDNEINSTGLLQLAQDADVSGQHWQIKAMTDGTYILRTMFLGPSRHLDVYGDKTKTPVLQPAGNYSGQKWIIAPWGDGTWHLSNTYSGSDVYLDSKKHDTKVKLKGAEGGRATQRWSIIPICGVTEDEF
ncbi:unnamed protein product [Periconia digitata]|uniref:Ricin B lectin domain-containing protein n=1 Tax=Periconia digitata TaxID=1303443 RepID=A0A9W4UTB2_9PLEO|nr:unnamed protein product [Periconia digitata]